MAHTMAPPKSVYLNDASSLRSFRRSPTPSLRPETPKLKSARSFGFLTLTDPDTGSHMKKSKAKEFEFISEPPLLAPGGEHKSRPFATLKSVLGGRSSASPRPSLLHRISNTFRKEPKQTTPPSPSQSAFAKKKRDIALLERGLLPPDLDISDDEWDPHHIPYGEPRERKRSFNFGLQSKRSLSGPLTRKVTPEPVGSPSPRIKKVPSALNLDRGRLSPSIPAPTRRLPSSPSEIQTPSSQRLFVQRRVSRGSIHSSSSLNHSQEEASHRPTSRYGQSIASDEESTLATPSLASCQFNLDFSINPLKSAAAAIGLTTPIVWEGDMKDEHGIPWDDEDEIDPDRPSPFLYSPSEYQSHTPTTSTTPVSRTVNPTIHTQGTIAAGVEAIEDEEGRRIAELAYLT